MAFDLQEYRDAHRPWAFTIGVGRARRTFTARHVSAPQVLRYQDKLVQADGNPQRVNAAIRWLLRLAFPWRASYLLRGDPVHIVLHLEPGARTAALADFFKALRGDPAPTQNGQRAMAGTSSQTPTLTPMV